MYSFSFSFHWMNNKKEKKKKRERKNKRTSWGCLAWCLGWRESLSPSLLRLLLLLPHSRYMHDVYSAQKKQQLSGSPPTLADMATPSPPIRRWSRRSAGRSPLRSPLSLQAEQQQQKGNSNGAPDKKSKKQNSQGNRLHTKRRGSKRTQATRRLESLESTRTWTALSGSAYYYYTSVVCECVRFFQHHHIKEEAKRIKKQEEEQHKLVVCVALPLTHTHTYVQTQQRNSRSVSGYRHLSLCCRLLLCVSACICATVCVFVPSFLVGVSVSYLLVVILSARIAVSSDSRSLKDYLTPTSLAARRIYIYIYRPEKRAISLLTVCTAPLVRIDKVAYTHTYIARIYIYRWRYKWSACEAFLIINRTLTREGNK